MGYITARLLNKRLRNPKQYFGPLFWPLECLGRIKPDKIASEEEECVWNVGFQGDGIEWDWMGLESKRAAHLLC